MECKKHKKTLKSVLKKREKRRLKREFKQKLKAWREQVIIRDDYKCQKCMRDLGRTRDSNDKTVKNVSKHVHHIISLQAIKRKYLDLLTDINNGVLLCPACHKFLPDSPHQGGFEFCLWLEIYKNTQYHYLKNYLILKM